MPNLDEDVLIAAWRMWYEGQTLLFRLNGWLLLKCKHKYCLVFVIDPVQYEMNYEFWF